VLLSSAAAWIQLQGGCPSVCLLATGDCFAVWHLQREADDRGGKSIVEKSLEMHFCSEFWRRSEEPFSRETLLLLTVLNRTSEVKSLLCLLSQICRMVKYSDGEEIRPGEFGGFTLFKLPWTRKCGCFFVMTAGSLSSCMPLHICSSLTPEHLGVFYSYPVFRTRSIIGQCSLNIYFRVPKNALPSNGPQSTK
jgi:hypothetical protein